MIDPFRGLLPFLTVAETLSFRRAGERLGVSTAAVSKSVAALEADLGVRLLDRSSRRVALSPEGRAVAERARVALDAAREARELAADAQKEPAGEVVISLSFILGRPVSTALARLAERWPKVRLRLRFSDRIVNLAEDRVDLALRMGELEDSSLVVRRLHTPRWCTVASPALLARVGVPDHPEALLDLPCLPFIMPTGRLREWDFQGLKLPIRGSMAQDYGEGLLTAALAGGGFTQVLDFMAAPHLREGRLVEVLAEQAAPGPTISAVSLPGRGASPRVRVVLDALRSAFLPA